jgi:hypothetical protein
LGGDIMPDYEKMYFRLFNRISDAIGQVEETNYGLASDILKQAQVEGEEIYLSEEIQKG